MDHEQLWTVSEVAQFLRVTHKTVYRLVQRGRVPSFKVGWIWRFRRVEIQQWLEEQRPERELETGHGMRNRRQR